MRYSADAGKTWRELSPPDRGLIDTLETFPNGRSIAVTKLDYRWQAYVSDDLFSGHWRKIEQTDLPKGYENFAFKLGDRLGVMTHNGTTIFVDAHTLAVERIDASSTIWGAFATPSGLLVKESMGWQRTHSVSEDAGKSWLVMQLNYNVNLVALKDMKTIYASNPGRKGGLFDSQDAALLVSCDGGKNWSPASIPTGFRFIRRLVVSEVDGSVLAFADDGQVMRSRDEGTTWVRDF